MYHAIVRRKLARAFRDINDGAYHRILPQFAASHRHVMLGRHALAGERRSLAATTAWYGRLKRLMPDLRFEVTAIVVSGWPWRTRAFVTWRDRFSLPGGETGSNQGVHEFELAWGKVRSLVVHCDTERLQHYCERMADGGRLEAIAPPIAEAPLPA